MKIGLEPEEPALERRQHPPEVSVVAFLPNAPGRNDEYVHKHRVRPPGSFLMHKLEPVTVAHPIDPQLHPASPTERTMEEKMLNRFFGRVITEEASVHVITQFHASPL